MFGIPDKLRNPIMPPPNVQSWNNLSGNSNFLQFANQTAEHQQLGAMYVLTALTIVSHSAADSLPWLYASVV